MSQEPAFFLVRFIEVNACFIFPGFFYIGKGNFSNVNIEANSNISKDVIITIYYSGLAEATVKIIKNLINEGEFSLNIKGTINANTLFGMSIIKQTFNATKTYP